MKATVIFHSADYDGIFCREIARKFLPDAELIGWNFGDPAIKMPSLTDDGLIYVLDLPVDKPLGFDYGLCPMQPFVSPRHFVWIDHHKTSIETHPADIPGYRIDGVAACRLAWQWFTNKSRTLSCLDSGGMASRQDFLNRKVSEPLAVRLAGEYDVWDKRDPDAETFQYSMRVSVVDEFTWKGLLNGNDKLVEAMLQTGAIAQRYAQKIDADLVRQKSYRLKWEGLDFLVLNTGRFNSLTFAALDVPETGHDALMGYCFNGKVWTVSIYHSKHRTDLDLSEIAKRYGGGGHKGAAGFTCDKLPF